MYSTKNIYLMVVAEEAYTHVGDFILYNNVSI